jgi:hypothetical protein
MVTKEMVVSAVVLGLAIFFLVWVWDNFIA